VYGTVAAKGCPEILVFAVGHVFKQERVIFDGSDSILNVEHWCSESVAEEGFF
jgi:hypothetical protein